MTCLKYLSTCPCPRCLLENSKIHRIGSKSDTRDRLKLIRVDSESRRNAVDAARRLIFEKGIDVASDRLKYFLEGESLTPTRVCLKVLVPFFSLILFRMPFRNGYIVMVSTSIKCSRLISSIEFELGVWKATFTHFLRILFSYGDGKIQELNKRYDFMGHL